MNEPESRSLSVIEKIRSLRMTYNIFQLNDRELAETLNSFRQPESLLLWGVDNYQEFHNFQLNVLRQFHNYLASAKTLVDHTRKLVDDIYINTEFGDEYEVKKREQFADKPLINFVQQLRNYTLHRTLPITVASLSPKWESSISLDIIVLREWDKWSSKERAYLERIGDKVALGKIIDGYTYVIEDFYEWFYKRQKELHPDL